MRSHDHTSAAKPQWFIGIEIVRFRLAAAMSPRAFFRFALFTGRSLGASFDDGSCETAALPRALERSRLDVVAFELAAAAPPSFALELKPAYI
ncbi:hypothetical protein [Bradyrhizobium algeriense]|uniref:hypothetical protein n=1 Tax=Bradyrhizobium algeriense TaxID=634784 RepID=UPI001FCEB476|nr:hypothetical protein [Bradyrhizobium algeriense]